MSDLTQLIAIGLGAGAIGLGLILGILFFFMKPKPQPGLGTTQRDPATNTPAGGVWNYLIYSDGTSGLIGNPLTAKSGQLIIADGNISFVLPGEPAPLWRYPCSQVAVRPKGPIAIGTLQIWTPEGEYNGTASREHVNRMVTNTAKDFRAVGYSKEAAAAAVASGARYY